MEKVRICPMTLCSSKAVIGVPIFCPFVFSRTDLRASFTTGGSLPGRIVTVILESSNKPHGSVVRTDKTYSDLALTFNTCEPERRMRT